MYRAGLSIFVDLNVLNPALCNPEKHLETFPVLLKITDEKGQHHPRSIECTSSIEAQRIAIAILGGNYDGNTIIHRALLQ